ncbi:MAG: pyruvate dehydrogenase (acetyl-transferring) E1 component subunit alpha, partial [Chlamydiales bacterium]|nr:pyruvate dehydrogenase (acetyl-transferring) E1 component subunit alpha [Chlamydiales bacterium]
EVVTQRFRGHSISDPGLYRSKDELQGCMERDPLLIMFKTLTHFRVIEEEEYHAIDKEMKDLAIAAIQYAESSPWPDPITLEEDVLSP